MFFEKNIVSEEKKESKTHGFLLHFLIFLLGYLFSIGVYKLASRDANQDENDNLLAKSPEYNLEKIEPYLNQTNFIPVAIIGGGSAGFTAGLYFAQAGYQPIVFVGKNPGGALAKSNNVTNWPGTKFSHGQVIMQNQQEQAAHAGANLLEEEVVDVDFTTWPFTIKCKDLVHGKLKEYKTLLCVICTGSTPNKLGIAGEWEFWGRGVTNCAVCDGPLVKNKTAVVVGGGDSAVTETIFLSSLANQVILVVRGNKLRAKKLLADKLSTLKNVQILYNSNLKKIGGDEHGVTHVEIETKELPLSKILTEGVFLAIGSEPNTNLIKKQLKLESNGCIATTLGQRTSIPLVYAAGDVTTRKFRQSVIAAGNACIAALDGIDRLMSLGIYPSLFTSKNEKTINTDQKKMEKNMNAEVFKISTESELEQHLQKAKNENKILVLDFFANWCGPCQKLMPIISNLAKELSQDVNFCKIDIDEGSELARHYQVRGIPTLVILNGDGKQLQSPIVGFVEQEVLKSKLISLKNN